jgi:hypothetical protein
MNNETMTTEARGFKAPAKVATPWRVATLAILAVTAFGFAAGPASARTSVYVAAPVYVAPIYPPATIYAPRPVYVAPAPAYVAPAPVYAAPICHPYKTRIFVGGVSHKVTGTACRQPDGSWRVVN